MNTHITKFFFFPRASVHCVEHQVWSFGRWKGFIFSEGLSEVETLFCLLYGIFDFGHSEMFA